MILPMIRLAIVVEGRTEEEFVKQLLAAHLNERGVEAKARLVGEGKRSSRGGNVTVDRVAKNMAELSHSFDAVTTLVDFYGFQRRLTSDATELEQRIDATYASAPHRRLRSDHVFSYVQRHEFEALLFSDVSAFARVLDIPQNAASALAGVRAQFASPEDINDSPDTAPSKRIRGAIPDYNKVTDGSVVATEVGLDAMRRECPRFAAWLTRLESLGDA